MLKLCQKYQEELFFGALTPQSANEWQNLECEWVSQDYKINIHKPSGNCN